MSLVELITVVSIIAILSLVSFPSYLQYLQRARRTEAKTALLRIATNQERFYLQNRTYTSNLAQLGFPDQKTESGYYALSVPFANTLDYQVIAVPSPGSAQAADTDCQLFSIDDRNDRDAAPDPKGQCW